MADAMYPYEYIFAAVLYAESFAGFIINVIILAVTFLKWRTLRCLQTYYKILGCLVMSRSLYFLSTFIIYIFQVFYTLVFVDIVVLVAVDSEVMFLYYSDLWFSTVLSVFYCVKITSYNWKVLAYLKTKLSAAVSWLLLLSLIVSVSFGVLFGFYLFDVMLIGALENTTVHNGRRIRNNRYKLLASLLGCFPFLTICVTIFLLLHSLWMHTRRMRSSGSGFQSPNLEAHFSAVKSTSLFLVLQIMYFTLMNVMLLTGLKDWRLLLAIIIHSFPLLHSLYIIFSNNDLKESCISFLKDLKRGDCC